MNTDRGYGYDTIPPCGYNNP